jgi:hypothetical protein
MNKKVLFIFAICSFIFLFGCGQQKGSHTFSMASCATKANSDFTGCINGYMCNVNVWATKNYVIDLKEENQNLKEKYRKENEEIEAMCIKEINKFTSELFTKTTKQAEERRLTGWHYLLPVPIRGFEGNLQGSFSGTTGGIFGGYMSGKISGHIEDNVKVYFAWEYSGKTIISTVNVKKVYFEKKPVQRPTIRFKYDIEEVNNLFKDNGSGYFPHPNQFVETASEATIRISPEQFQKFLRIVN